MNWLKDNWFKIIAVILSFYALNDLPIGYFQILRWFIFSSSAYICYVNYTGKKQKALWVFLIIGILFNPIVPIYLLKSTWHILNILTGLIYLISMFPSNLSNVKSFMNKKSITHIGSATLIIVLLIGASFFVWTQVNIGLNKGYLLKKSVREYSDLIEVGLTEQAYNEYLTPEAKAKVTYRNEDIPFTPEEAKAERIRVINCKDNSENSFIKWNCIFDEPKHKQKQIEIPSLETFTKYAVTRKNDWKNVGIDKIIYTSKNRADVLLKLDDKTKHTKDSLETWYFQDGKWLRDF